MSKKILIYFNKFNYFCYTTDENFEYNNIVVYEDSKPFIYQYLTCIETDEDQIDTIVAVKLSDAIGYIFAVNLYPPDFNFLNSFQKEFTVMHCADNWTKIGYMDEPKFNKEIKYHKIKNDIRDEGMLIENDY